MSDAWCGSSFLGVQDSNHFGTCAHYSRISIPGEIETECTERRRAEGIPLPEAVVRHFVELGEELGVLCPVREG